jgi:hypothetical protein
MSLNFHIIQYVDDPMTGEGKNIAIVAHDGRRGYLRMLGMEKYHLQTGFFSAISSRAHASAWVYREWAEWFQRLVSEEAKDSAIFMAELAKLE